MSFVEKSAAALAFSRLEFLYRWIPFYLIKIYDQYSSRIIVLNCFHTFLFAVSFQSRFGCVDVVLEMVEQMKWEMGSDLNVCGGGFRRVEISSGMIS
jgi:hypothetical protein